MEPARLLPAEAVRPRWSSASALIYIGALVVLLATLALLGILGDEHGNAALVGFSAIAVACSLALAFSLESRGRDVVAGVLATVTVVLFAVLVGSLENLAGIIDVDAAEDEYQPGLLVVELSTIAAAYVALRRFVAPLLVLPAALAFWIALADFGSVFAWDDAGEALSLVVGIVLMAAGLLVDRAERHPFGFWLHAVGGLAFGGAVLSLVDGDFAWVLVGLLSLGYVAAAYRLERSSYAVLGAIGIVATTAYFSFDGFAAFAGFPFSEPPAETPEPWESALWFVGAGLLIVALGLLGERGRPDAGELEA